MLMLCPVAAALLTSLGLARLDWLCTQHRMEMLCADHAYTHAGLVYHADSVHLEAGGGGHPSMTALPVRAEGRCSISQKSCWGQLRLCT